MRELQYAPRPASSLPTAGVMESHPAPGTLPADDAASRLLTRARQSESSPPPVTGEASGAAGKPRRLLARPWVVLGLLGSVGGAATLGVVAHRVAHPLSTVALIAALGGVAGGASGAALPPLVRALKWSVLAAAALAVAAGALWAIHQVDPLLVRQFVPRW